MIAYTVHEQPEPPADRLDRADALVFVRDGFSLAAALFAPFWLAANRLWLGLAGYVAIAVLIAVIAYLFALAPGWTGLLTVALHVLVGFEADTLRRMALDSRGWTEIGSVVGRDADDCERRFFANWLPYQPAIALPGAGRQPPPARSSPAAVPALVNATPDGEEKPALPKLGVWRRFLRGRGPR